jgi:hypothetical protein
MPSSVLRPNFERLLTEGAGSLAIASELRATYAAELTATNQQGHDSLLGTSSNPALSATSRAVLEFLEARGFDQDYSGGISLRKPLSPEETQQLLALISENFTFYGVTFELLQLSAHGPEVLQISPAGTSSLNLLARNLARARPGIRLIIDPSGKLYEMDATPSKALGKFSSRDNWMLFPLSVAVFPGEINSIQDPTPGHEIRHLQSDSFFRRGRETSLFATVRDSPDGHCAERVTGSDPPMFLADELRCHLFNVSHAVRHLHQREHDRSPLCREPSKTKLCIIAELEFLVSRSILLSVELEYLAGALTENCYAFLLPSSRDTSTETPQISLCYPRPDGTWTYAFFKTYAKTSDDAKKSLQMQLQGLAALGITVAGKARLIIDAIGSDPEIRRPLDGDLFRVAIDDNERVEPLNELLPHFPEVAVYDVSSQADSLNEALTELVGKLLTAEPPQYAVLERILKHITKSGKDLPVQTARLIASHFTAKNSPPSDLRLNPKMATSLLLMCSKSLRSNKEDAAALHSLSRYMFTLAPHDAQLRNNFAWDSIQVGLFDKALYHAYKAVQQTVSTAEDHKVPEWMLDTLITALSKCASAAEGTQISRRRIKLMEEGLRILTMSTVTE